MNLRPNIQEILQGKIKGHQTVNSNLCEEKWVA